MKQELSTIHAHIEINIMYNYYYNYYYTEDTSEVMWNSNDWIRGNVDRNILNLRIYIPRASPGELCRMYDFELCKCPV